MENNNMTMKRFTVFWTGSCNGMPEHSVVLINSDHRPSRKVSADRGTVWIHDRKTNVKSIYPHVIFPWS